MELTQNHIEELDSLVRIVLDNNFKVLTEEVLEKGPFNVEESKSKFYLKILESEELLSLDKSGHAYLVEVEPCKVHLQRGGFKQLAIDQMLDDEKQKEKEVVQEELNELQLKQLKHETKQMIFKSWWFWLAAVIVLYTFIRQLIIDLA
ncbi:hypothetical protein [Ekhidna sp.]|jgi:hypothetical protein|uniref:hypothetical protein n=1 Tax=Ekhidna sp. TaxID=2608089 RepID=UPI0032EE6CD1